MKYSLVVISKNRHDLLCKVIDDLKRIEGAPHITVVESTDKPDEDRIEGIAYVPIPLDEGSFSNQRNIAVEHAPSEYIIFADDDITINDDWYKNLTDVIEQNNDCLGTMGAVFPYQPTIIGFCEGVLGHPGGGFKFHNHSQGKLHPMSQVATCNTILKKSAILEAGGFDLLNRYGSEDTDLSIRITKKFGPNRFIYAPDARVFHKPRNALRKIIPWYIRRGKADADLFLKHTTHLDYLLKTTILLKMLPFVILSILFKNVHILTIIFLLWYVAQLTRTRFMFHYFKYYNFSGFKRWMTFLIFPFVKMTADIMFDLGRITRLIGR